MKKTKRVQNLGYKGFRVKTINKRIAFLLFLVFVSLQFATEIIENFHFGLILSFSVAFRFPFLTVYRQPNRNLLIFGLSGRLAA